MHANRSMTDETEKSSSAAAIGLAVLAIVVAIFMVKFGLQTLTWVEGKMWATQAPWLNRVPQPLPAPSPLATPTAKAPQLKEYDFEVNAPWPGNPKPAPTETSVGFHYDGGQVLVFFDPEAQLDTLRSIQNANPAEFQRFTNIFADKPINSNFELYRAVYNAAPSQASPLMDARDAMRMNVLLLWKLSFGLDLPSDTGLYSFDWNNIHGFQFGDPGKGVPVALRAFDDRGHQFRFLLTTTPGSNAKITQDDIDRILQTIQPVPFVDR
jgi:hypothetical protein